MVTRLDFVVLKKFIDFDKKYIILIETKSRNIEKIHWEVKIEILTIPQVLRQKWEDGVVDAVIELLNKSNSKLKEDTLVFVEDKFERRLTAEISKVNEKISESHANLIKWMFIFWIGQIGVILGILFAFFK